MDLSKVVNQAKQAKDTLRKNIEKNIPVSLKDLKDSRRLTNDKILAGLKAMGVATREDLHELEKKMEALGLQVEELLKKGQTPETKE